MAGRIYALFVGIDDYLPPVNRLGGCVNDIQSMSTLLGSMLGERLQSVTIRDRDATRENVINTFRTHLGQAKKDDVALFYYSGHGSQEIAAPEFWPGEPDHHNETIVCVDSRTPGQHDLADKELQGLVAFVAADGAEVVLILDCCHSGSGARGASEAAGPVDQHVRQVELDLRPRPVEEYDLSGLQPDSVAAPTGIVGTSRSAGRRGLGAVSLGQREGRYVLLAACGSSQTAKEQRIGDQRRGVFSASLQTALRDIGGHLTYADLVSLATIRVRDLAADQTPQLESAIAADEGREFLAGLTDRRGHHRLLHSAGGWIVDAGFVHGIEKPTGEQTTVFAVYPLDDQIVGQTAVATASVESVDPDRSRVAVTTSGAPLDQQSIYAALPQSWPIAPLAVCFEGTNVARELLSTALITAATGAEVVVTAPEHAEFTVVSTSIDWAIRRVADGRLVAAPVADVTQTGADRVVRDLGRIARWRRLRDLQTSVSGIVTGDILFDVHQVGGPSDSAPSLRLEYGRDGSRPQVHATVTNTSRQRLYVALLGLSDLFGVRSQLHQSWGEWLEPGASVQARGGRPITVEVADQLWQNGVTEVTDILKVIACTQEFSAQAWAQGELDAPTSRSANELIDPVNPLDRMFRRAATRGFADDDSDLVPVKWGTASCTITTHRPTPGVVVGEQGAEIAPGVMLTAPPGLQVSARLVSGGSVTRDAGGGSLPPLLRAASTPVTLNPTRDVVDEPDALELRWTQPGSVISTASPIVVRLPLDVDGDDSIVPFAWDGEFWLPVGRTVRHTRGQLDVAIEQLPVPDASNGALDSIDGERSLTGSIRILFRKLVGRKLGLSYSWPRLAVATVENGEVTYDAAGVAEAVASADTVLLYVHGIIGDTAGMVRHGADRGLTQLYDLTLTFDYENINTPIAQTARDLGDALRKAGFGEGSGPRLDIVAHSMGGLVSRAYVEQEGGRGIVSKLVTAGTPHRGSPWPHIQDWATSALGIGLNGLGLSTFWPAAVLGGLAQLIERYDDALDDMNADSEFIKNLAATEDPEIPYYLIAGDRTALEQERAASLLGRLSLRVWKTVDALAFFQDANDIAVTVTSASTVPDKWNQPPTTIRVGCDHMTYFDSDSGATALREALLGGR